MPSKSIKLLKTAINNKYGHMGIELYGSHPNEEHGTCFKIGNIPATFSVITLDGTLPFGHYDIQIEGIPPSDYVYTAELKLDKFLSLIDEYFKPIENWPETK